MTPTFQIIVAGNDITSDISTRLISIDASDGVDEKSDGVTIALEDAEQSMAIPASGARLEISLGYGGVNDILGSYIVDEVSIDGPPDIITIQASAAPFVSDRAAGGNSSLTSRKSQSYDSKTLGEIVKTVAASCNMVAAVSDDLADRIIDHVAQISESDANLLLRLARRYGATLKITEGYIVLTGEDGGKTISGRPLEETLTPYDVSSWNVRFGGKSQGVTKIKAKKHSWLTGHSEEFSATVENPQFAQTSESTDDE
jgi:phage protein D